MKLTQEELFRFEKAGLLHKLRQAEYRSLKTEQELRRLQLKQLEQEAVEKSAEAAREQREHRAFVDEIRARFNLTDGWGFDPITGDVTNGNP